MSRKAIGFPHSASGRAAIKAPELFKFFLAAPVKYQGLVQACSLTPDSGLFKIADEDNVCGDEAARGGELFAVA